MSNRPLASVHDARKKRPKKKVLTPAQIDRLCWRAGFGPTPALRKRFTGKTHAEAVTFLLGRQGPLVGPAPRKDGQPLDPLGDDSDVDIVLQWLDRMVRAQNPFVERLTLFWHRHWANSKAEVAPATLMLKQNGLLRSYSDLGASPNATFRGLALAMGRDPAMLRYLTGEQNVKGHPNENYAREIMELFCLGVRDDQGRMPYTEDDVVQAARAFSGWVIANEDSDSLDRIRGEFDADRFSVGSKVLFGVRRDYDAKSALDAILARPAHPRFLLRKLWHEFIVAEPPKATLNDLVATYRKGGTKLKPVLRKILMHPLIFESPGEPNMVKPPVVFVAGVLRQLGRPITDARPAELLETMGQVPYFPPNVSGWEGGLSWLNTNTALARFELVGHILEGMPADAPAENGTAAYNRAYKACGKPWLAPATKAALQRYARSAPDGSGAERRARQLVLRALILAGPDAQVM